MDDESRGDLMALIFLIAGCGIIFVIAHAVYKTDQSKESLLHVNLEADGGRDKSQESHQVQATPVESNVPPVSNELAETSELPAWKVLAYGNGYSWRHASEDAKTEFCDHLAAASPMGLSSQFFYDAINTAYRTSDSDILETPLEFTANYVEKGAEELAREGRLDE